MIKLQYIDDKYRTQRDWFEFFKNKKGMRMISYLDILKLNEAQLEEVRKNFGGVRWEMTSSQIIHEADGSTTIVHYADTNHPIKHKIKNIPRWEGKPLLDVLDTEIGLQYFRALHNNMRAKKKDIVEDLERISKKPSKKIFVWTAMLDTRAEHPVRAVRLYYGYFDDRFYVSGNDWYDDIDGLSRGVLLDSAKRTNSRLEFSDKEIKALQLAKKLLKKYGEEILTQKIFRKTKRRTARKSRR